MFKLRAHHHIFVAGLLIVIPDLPILRGGQQIGLPLRVRVLPSGIHQRIVWRPPGAKKGAALTGNYKLGDIAHIAEHEIFIQHAFRIELSQISQRLLRLRLYGAIGHISLRIAHPLLGERIKRGENRIQLKLVIVSALSRQISVTDQTDGVPFPVSARILFHKGADNFYGVLHRFRFLKSQLVHPVLPEPQQVRPVHEARLRKGHQLSVHHCRIQRGHLIAVIHLDQPVAGAVLKRLREIRDHAASGQLNQRLPVLHHHHVGQLPGSDCHPHIGSILLLTLLEHILILDVQRLPEIAGIDVVLIGISLRHVGVVFPGHLSQRIGHQRGIFSIWRRCRLFPGQIILREAVPG